MDGFEKTGRSCSARSVVPVNSSSRSIGTMAKTLQEYVAWLDERGLQWPAAPKPVPAKAAPYLKPLRGIRAVTWSVYGTLLRISGGQLLFEHPEMMPMQVALEKTVQEFGMWTSMTRRPLAPWKQLYDQYTLFVEERQMSSTRRKGDVPEVDSSAIWLRILRLLAEKDYDYEISVYGSPDELSDKVAYFFHASLQGVEAAPNALAALKAVGESSLKQGLLADAQAFTLVQMLRALKSQGTLAPLGRLFALDCLTLSFQEGIRKPSPSLYRVCLEQFAEHDIEPGEVLHVGSRLREDLAVAKQAGMRTALYAADQTSLRAEKADIKNPDTKPDRLLTDLIQIRDILEL